MLEDIKNAALDAANIKSGEETSLDGSQVSENDSITLPLCTQDVITALLPVGKAEPITAEKLAKAIGVSDPRYITHEISKLRHNGVPICASCDPKHPGYYLPENLAELERYLRSLDHRQRELTQLCVALRRVYDQMSGQEVLF